MHTQQQTLHTIIKVTQDRAAQTKTTPKQKQNRAALMSFKT